MIATLSAQQLVVPRLLAMLSIQYPIRGDEALLRLAQARLGEAGIGGELYPHSPDHLRSLLAFRPPGLACTAHLPRDLDLLQAHDRERFLAFARAAAGQVYGLVVHDQLTFVQGTEVVAAAFRRIDSVLTEVPDRPYLFVEYASGLAPEFYASLFETTAGLDSVSAALDISHVAIQLCRTAYARRYPGQDVCQLTPDSAALPERIEDVQQCVVEALPGVLALIGRLGALAKPLHFHLHDGHPLSNSSAFGVADHLSFLEQITLPFSYRGRRTLAGVFGLRGLRLVVAAALRGLAADKLSFMLEVHPREGRRPLGKYSALFSHWHDQLFAERMNYWLDSLLENASLLRDSCEEQAR
jgi:hypothetical protein